MTEFLQELSRSIGQYIANHSHDPSDSINNQFIIDIHSELIDKVNDIE